MRRHGAQERGQPGRADSVPVHYTVWVMRSPGRTHVSVHLSTAHAKDGKVRRLILDGAGGYEIQPFG